MAIANIKGQGDDGLDNELDDGLDDGLSDLIRRHTARRPDEKKEIETVGERKFGELWVKYERALNIVDSLEADIIESCLDKAIEVIGKRKFRELCVKHKQVLNIVDSLKVDIIKSYLDKTVDDILTQSQIEELFRLTIAYEDNEHHQKCTKLIINRLIQLSYNAGNNGFVLNTNELSRPIDELCANLCGTHNKPINITINGDVGRYFCSQGKFLSVTINGNTGDICNYYGSNSSFIINGNAKSISGIFCSFIVNGDVERIDTDIDFQSSSSYTINGEVKDQEFSVYATRHVYKTSNPKTLDVFLRRIPIFRGHNVYFIDEEGNEKQVGMWDRFVKRMGYQLK